MKTPGDPFGPLDAVRQSGAVAENADITGKVIFYTSMYQDICDMMSEALKPSSPTPKSNSSRAAPAPCKPRWPAKWKAASWAATC